MLSDIYMRAKELHVAPEVPRSVFLVRQLEDSDAPHILRPFFADETKIAARDHSSLAVNHTHDTVCGFN